MFVDAQGGCISDENLEAITIEGTNKKSIIGYLSELHNVSQNTLFNDLHGSIESQEKVLATAPSFNKGLQAIEDKDWDKSIEQFTEVIDTYSGFAKAYNNRGFAHSDKGDKEQAMADYNKAIELDPGLAEAYCNRGTAYCLLGEHEKAMMDYNECERLAQEQNLSDLLAEVHRLKRQLK